MAVEVKVTATLQKLVGGQRSVLAEGSTIRELLEDLDRKHPGIKDMVMVDGEIHRFVNIYLNDEDVRFLDKLDTRLQDGDVVSILPALAGGRGA
jgi:MoaD family protein